MIEHLALLVALVTFGVAALSDIESRRVKNILWVPAFAIGLILLALRGGMVLDAPQQEQMILAIRISISLGFIIPLALAFWYTGLFGGADARALIVLAILLPQYPSDAVVIAGMSFPLLEPTVGIFSISALTNGLLLTAAYPLWLYARNTLNGEFTTLWAFVAIRLPVSSLPTTHGKLVQTPDTMTFHGLDLDALRMYLQWRGIDLTDLHEQPHLYRNHPPTDPQPVGDGRIPNTDTLLTDGGMNELQCVDDDWCAEAFLDEYSAYGTDPQTLRDGLDLIADADSVWVTPGIPLIVSFFLGIVTAALIGDILAAGLEPLS